jgi:hypothetical protein
MLTCSQAFRKIYKMFVGYVKLYNSKGGNIDLKKKRTEEDWIQLVINILRQIQQGLRKTEKAQQGKNND